MTLWCFCVVVAKRVLFFGLTGLIRVFWVARSARNTTTVAFGG